jgi:predicted amidohydrolase
VTLADQAVRDPGALRVRLLQTDPQLGDVEGNLAHLDGLVSARPDVDLVVTPELATHGYHLGVLDDSDPVALEDPRLAALGRHGPTVVAGFAEATGHRVHNSAAVIGAQSTGVQRKLYLPNYAGWEELKHFRPGGGITLHRLGEADIAVLICNDMWQPVLPWLAVHAGASVIVAPVNSILTTAQPPSARAWEAILVHTAITLQAYVVFVNRVGEENGNRFWGGSRVLCPDGDTMVELGDEPGEAVVDLDLAGQRRLRRRWPLLQQSRLDLIAAEATRLHAAQT